MLIAFEGIDRSGKTTLSVNFAKILNSNFRDEAGLLEIDPHFGDFIWTKEPSFSTEESDKLNSPGYIDEYRRERLFFESRVRHQSMLAGKNVICDRYIWSALAYMKRFSPNCFRFGKELYLSDRLFTNPDLYVFLNIPPEICAQRDEGMDVDILTELSEAYESTKQYIKVPIIELPHIEGEEEMLFAFSELFKGHLQDHDR